MKQLNKKAAECTAIHPTAKITNLSGLVETNVAQNIKNGKFTILEACRLSGITLDELTEFYLIRGYIRKEPYGYSATLLGVEKGCFVNDKDFNARITTKGICKVASVFAA